MGRGRAKAKQTKVARDLKYRTHETDFKSLAQELHGDEATPVDRVDRVDRAEPVDDSDEYDKWSDYSDSTSRD
jgi:hypothetical protein